MCGQKGERWTRRLLFIFSDKKRRRELTRWLFQISILPPPFVRTAVTISSQCHACPILYYLYPSHSLHPTEKNGYLASTDNIPCRESITRSLKRYSQQDSFE